MFRFISLRTEQMVDPMGLDTAVPRMSWRLESSQRNVMQTAYRILVASSPELLAQDKGDLWDSEKWNPMRPYGFLIKEAFEKQSACLLESEAIPIEVRQNGASLPDGDGTFR